MADEPNKPTNSLAADVRGGSRARGDVPEALRRRYYTDARGGAGLAFYVDATIQRPAFRDEGRRLVAARTDPNAIRDMAAIARHRGWTIVSVRGSAEFRREAWLAARSLGIEVRGFRPTERDLQALERRLERRTRTEARGDPAVGSRPLAPRAEQRSGEAQLKLVETVVRARVADTDQRAHILAAARDRIAVWLERGARFDRLEVSAREAGVGLERRRSR